MAVKVTSEKPVKTYKAVCQKCCYELEYTPIDIVNAKYESWGETNEWSYIICPRELCQHRVEVKKIHF